MLHDVLGIMAERVHLEKIHHSRCYQSRVESVHVAVKVVVFSVQLQFQNVHGCLLYWYEHMPRSMQQHFELLF